MAVTKLNWNSKTARRMPPSKQAVQDFVADRLEYSFDIAPDHANDRT
jgi:hypothetical protein